MFRNRLQLSLTFCAFSAAFVMIAVDMADARGRISIGSRGTRTYSTPPPTTTAPAARPMERTATQPKSPTATVAARPALQNAPVGSGIGRPGFMSGLLGAGLIGLLLGAGLTGGLGGLASFLGLALQIGVMMTIGWLLFAWWQGRNQPTAATASIASARQSGPYQNGAARNSFGRRT